MSEILLLKELTKLKEQVKNLEKENIELKEALSRNTKEL